MNDRLVVSDLYLHHAVHDAAGNFKSQHITAHWVWDAELFFTERSIEQAKLRDEGQKDYEVLRLSNKEEYRASLSD